MYILSGQGYFDIIRRIFFHFIWTIISPMVDRSTYWHNVKYFLICLMDLIFAPICQNFLSVNSSDFCVTCFYYVYSHPLDIDWDHLYYFLLNLDIYHQYLYLHKILVQILHQFFLSLWK